MSDVLKSAADTLAEQTRKLDIAVHFTHGDTEKAKKMIAGAYRDIFAVKVRFFSSSLSGAFLIFFHPEYLQIMNIFVLVTSSFSIEDLKTNIDWRTFEKQLKEIQDEGQFDQVLCNHAREEIFHSLDTLSLVEIKKLIDLNDAIALNHKFKKIAESKLGYQQIKISVDVEPTSSLDMEVYSITGKKIDPKDLQKPKSEEQGEGKAEPENPEDVLSGRDIKLIVNASLILSPIKGKDVSQLSEGERVKIKLVDKTPKSVQLAKAFNAYDEESGAFSAITGRIVSIKHDPAGGYRINAVVAKGIYAKIYEEEENIKVAIDDSGAAALAKAQNASSGKISPVWMIATGACVLLLLGTVIYFLVK